MSTELQHLEGLPLGLVSPVDLGRVQRELELLDNHLHELQIRAPGQEIKMPKTSHLMDELLGLNKLNLLVAADRQTLKQFLETVHERAPRLHISFSADPSPLFIQKLMTWLRREIHPVLLLTVGLQPNIGAGCMVRTTNRYFDLSLSKDFAKKREVLMKAMREATASGDEPQPVPAQPATAVPAAAPDTPADAPLQKPTKTYVASPHSPASATTAPAAAKQAQPQAAGVHA